MVQGKVQMDEFDLEFWTCKINNKTQVKFFVEILHFIHPMYRMWRLFLRSPLSTCNTCLVRLG